MSDPYVGEIRMLASQTGYAPRGWALCDGKLLNVREDDLLFQLIGTTYGGDGQTTYALPKLEPYQARQVLYLVVRHVPDAELSASVTDQHTKGR